MTNIIQEQKSSKRLNTVNCPDSDCTDCPKLLDDCDGNTSYALKEGLN